ncbi:MAG TPA: hypothetical protein VLK65_02350 [Vicinamibacteria bacterium]|nr:hypothetical protein [Vicinamibacteria bacterium]
MLSSILVNPPLFDLSVRVWVSIIVVRLLAERALASADPPHGLR